MKTIEISTPDGFVLVLDIDDETIYYSWWTPAGKEELASYCIDHNEVRQKALCQQSSLS